MQLIPANRGHRNLSPCNSNSFKLDTAIWNHF